MMQYLEEVTKLGEAGLKMAIEQTLGGSVAEKILFAGERLIERGRREGELVGLRKGELAGLRKGEIAGQRALLLRQLRLRFGALPDAAVASVQVATPSELEQMATRVLTAATLDDVVSKKKRRRGAPPRQG